MAAARFRVADDVGASASRDVATLSAAEPEHDPETEARLLWNLEKEVSFVRERLRSQFLRANWSQPPSLQFFDVERELALFEKLASSTALPRDSPLHDLVDGDGSVVRGGNNVST